MAAHAQITFGTSTRTFEDHGSGVFSNGGISGETLVYDAANDNWVYTQTDGTIVRFPGGTLNIDYYNTALSIEAPDGLKTEIHVDGHLQSVTNNAGYQLKFQYSSLPELIGVTAINRAVDYCDPMGVSCSASPGAQSVTYTHTFGEHSLIPINTTVIDALGRSTRWTNTQNF